MTLKQKLLALIASLLFSVTLPPMVTANTAVLATNITPPASIILTASTAPSTNTLQTRDPISIDCEVNNFETSYLRTYDEVVDHIRSMPGNATLGNQPGGGWCSRYSCTNGLAIYGCNDNLADMQVPWATMASYADAIKGKCKSRKKVHGHWKDIVLGQAFDADGWNVILGLKSDTWC